MKYLFNPKNKMAVPYSEELLRSFHDLIELLDENEARQAVSGVPVNVIIGARPQIAEAPKPAPEPKKPDTTVNFEMNIGGVVTKGINVSPANEPTPAPTAAPSAQDAPQTAKDAPEQKEANDAPASPEAPTESAAQASGEDGDKDPFAAEEAAAAADAAAERAPEKPADPFDGLNRDTVKMEDFEKVTDDQLHDFAKRVLNLDIEMSPQCEDKASIDYQKWVAFARTVIKKQVAKCVKIQRQNGK